jgi:hypothetical protein
MGNQELKDRQYNDLEKGDRMIHNDIPVQYSILKTNDWATRTQEKTEGQTVPAPLVTHVMLFKFHDTVYENKNSTK